MSDSNQAPPARAAEAYRQHGQAIDALLDELKAKLAAHAERAAGAPRNWGYPEELGHVEGLLRQIVASMG